MGENHFKGLGVALNRVFIACKFSKCICTYSQFCVCVCGGGGLEGGGSDHEVDSVTNIPFITVTINIIGKFLRLFTE